MSPPPQPLPALGSPAVPCIVVDDDIGIMELMVEILCEVGYAAVGTTSPITALKWAIHAPPALLVTDIMMHEMDGMALARELAANAKTADIGVLFVTAVRDPNRVFAAPIVVVMKPFTIAELTSAAYSVVKP